MVNISYNNRALRHYKLIGNNKKKDEEGGSLGGTAAK